MDLMKIRKNHIHFFILLFAVSSLLVHSPPEAFAEVEGVISTITVGAGPNSIAFDSENNRMYVTNSGGTWNENNPLAGDSISVIDTFSYEVETVTAAGAGGHGNTPHGIAFDSANNRMYYAIGNWQYVEDYVSVMNTADNSVSAKVTVGERPEDIAFDSANNRMYVTNVRDDSVSVINTANNSVIATVPVGEQAGKEFEGAPNGIAFDSANNRIYVANQIDDTVSVIDTATNSVIDTIPVGDNPNSIAFDPVNNRMYVTNYQDETVSVIGILPPTISSGGSDDLINPKPYLTDEILVSVGPNKPIVTQSDGISNIQIQKGDNITITLNAADDTGPVLDTNTFSGQSEVESVSLYTNFGPRPNGMNLYYANHLNDQRDTSKTFYEWYKYKDDVIYDFENTVSWAEAVVTTEDKFTISITDTDTETTSSTEGKLTITFSATWDEVMPKSEIIVKTADSQMGYSTTTLPFTLQVGEYDQSYEDVFGTNTNYRFVPLVSDIKVRESIEQWVDPFSGMTDERFVSSLGLDGDELPGYVKHLAQWVVEDKIDLADLIIAVEYIINVK